MATSTSRLTDLTMADLERCYRITQKLDACDTAVQSAAFPGKAAVRQLLSEAYYEAQDVARKGAPMALRKIEAGQYARKNATQEFAAWLLRLAGLNPPPAEAVPEGGSTDG